MDPHGHVGIDVDSEVTHRPNSYSVQLYIYSRYTVHNLFGFSVVRKLIARPSYSLNRPDKTWERSLNAAVSFRFEFFVSTNFGALRFYKGSVFG